jgi:hypothetical protein
MAVTGAGYRALAEICLKNADAAALEQVRERCLRSAAALIAMAEANERVEAGRAARVNGGLECRKTLQAP